MPADLEPPCGPDPDWDGLYRARGDEVVSHRPILTGDVFERVSVMLPDGRTKTKGVVVVQHPCAMRSDGVNLNPSLLVAELRTHPLIEPDDWKRYVKVMPLPDLHPEVDTGRRHQAAFLTSLYLVSPEQLQAGDRIACLSQLGVNLVMQRWVHHNSRVVVPTSTLQDVTVGVYEEADLIEEWCEYRADAGVSVTDATDEAMTWLREDLGGRTRQQRLDDPQERSAVRREMRAALKGMG